MALAEVNSSMIQAIGHDPTTNVLTVKFKSGPTWEYDGVSETQYANLLHAPSVGQEFLLRIKNVHKGRRI